MLSSYLRDVQQLHSNVVIYDPLRNTVSDISILQATSKLDQYLMVLIHKRHIFEQDDPLAQESRLRLTVLENPV